MIDKKMLARVQEIARKIEHALPEQEQENPQVIVVTKTQSFEDISKLYALGMTHFAENRVDALLKRQEEFPQSDITWHFIGTLQSRKVKDLIHKVDYIHSVDRHALIQEIDKRATKTINCFLQINIFNESSKHGFSIDDISSVLDSIQDTNHISIVGLMTMAPFDASEDIIRQGFTKMKQLQTHIESLQLPKCPCHFLSMGMSQDFEIATSTGATHLRIGSAFFDES